MNFYSAQSSGGGRVLKWAWCVCLFCFIFIFSQCCKSALLRTLIGLCRSCAPDLWSAYCFQCELMAKYENYGLPGRSVPPQVDSDKLRNELHSYSKHKCTAWHKMQRWELECHITWVKSCKYNIYFCILCLCIILCDARKVSENLTFILKQSLILWSFVVTIVTRPIGDSHQDLIRFNNNKHTK